MISLLALVTCLACAPQYGLEGNECTEAQIEAGFWQVGTIWYTCSQAVRIPPVAGADSYQVKRWDDGTGSWVIVGNTAQFQHCSEGTESACVYEQVDEHWYPDRDCTATTLCAPPADGSRYRYQFAPCHIGKRCDGYVPGTVLHIGHEMACYVGGPGGFRYDCGDSERKPIPRAGG